VLRPVDAVAAGKIGQWPPALGPAAPTVPLDPLAVLLDQLAAAVLREPRAASASCSSATS